MELTINLQSEDDIMIDGKIEICNKNGCKTCGREMRFCIIHDTYLPFDSCNWWYPFNNGENPMEKMT